MSKTKEKRYQIAASNGSDGPKITLSGDLSLNNIKSLKDDLTAYLNKSRSIKIVVKDAESIDLGFIQLIQSFAWTTLKSNNHVDVEMSLSSEQQKLLNNAGVKLKF